MSEWQAESIQRFAAFFESNEAAKALILIGSNANATTDRIDRWSDVDLVCVINDAQMDRFFPATRWLAAFGEIFGVEQSTSTFTRVTRVCFADFRRVDLVFWPESALKQVQNWPYSGIQKQVLFSRSTLVDAALESSIIAQRQMPNFDSQQFERMSQQFWFKAALAVTKVMRNDLLISLHLALDLARDCLVLAMIFRDVETGTTSHRYGGPYNDVIEQIPIDDFRPTPSGILDLILQTAFIYDSLAVRWSPSYPRKAEILQGWINDLQSNLSS